MIWVNGKLNLNMLSILLGSSLTRGLETESIVDLGSGDLLVATVADFLLPAASFLTSKISVFNMVFNITRVIIASNRVFESKNFTSPDTIMGEIIKPSFIILDIISRVLACAKDPAIKVFWTLIRGAAT